MDISTINKLKWSHFLVHWNCTSKNQTKTIKQKHVFLAAVKFYMSCHSLTINRMGLVPEHAGYPVPAHFIGPSTGVPSIQHVLQQTQSSIFICITKKRLSYHQNMVGLSSLCLLVWLYRLTHQSSPIAGLSVPTAGWSNPSRLLVSYILYSYIPSSSHHMSSSHFIYCLHPEEKKRYSYVPILSHTM